MALQTSGAISLNDVNIELGNASGSTISLNDAAVRSLAGVASGAISLSNLYGKSSVEGPYYSTTAPTYYWYAYAFPNGSNGLELYWNGVSVASASGVGYANYTSYSTSTHNYTRGTLQASWYSYTSTGVNYYYRYQISRSSK